MMIKSILWTIFSLGDGHQNPDQISEQPPTSSQASGELLPENNSDTSSSSSSDESEAVDEAANDLTNSSNIEIGFMRSERKRPAEDLEKSESPCSDTRPKKFKFHIISD